MLFERKLALPVEIKEAYPMDAASTRIFEERDIALKNILSGKDDRIVLIIGPCSADADESVLDYVSRLVKVQE
ncbi:MAG: 3-deoxy-7-phosphoheptulonate synthase, partial [Clostridia bacterium]|nr:3-deoxy-7-phosphoheptulonate synthase [Clostridia bacterium]